MHAIIIMEDTTILVIISHNQLCCFALYNIYSVWFKLRLSPPFFVIYLGYAFLFLDFYRMRADFLALRDLDPRGTTLRDLFIALETDELALTVEHSRYLGRPRTSSGVLCVKTRVTSW